VGAEVGAALHEGSTDEADALMDRVATSETREGVPACSPVGWMPSWFQSAGRLEYGVAANSHCICISSTLAPKVPM
jgi:hypothetical protein